MNGSEQTAALSLLLALVPGAVFAFLLPPGRERWAALAASPAVTMGLLTVAMGWLQVAGLRDGVVPVLAAELLVVVVALAGGAVARRVARRKSRAPIPFPAAVPAAAAAGRGPDVLARRTWQLEALSIAVPAALTVGFGRLLLGTLPQPPGWDAMNHGYLTRRILETGSTRVADVCSTGSIDPVQSCAFYPLAPDVVWAQAAHLGNGSVSAAMTAWMIVLGPVTLVAGAYACVRALGGNRVVAACAAAAPTFVGPMWTVVLTGRITEQTGPCLAPGIALLLALALRGHHPWRTGAFGGLAAAGLLASHTYDILLAAVLTVALAIAFPGGWRLRRLPVAVLGALLGAGVALLPLAGALGAAGGERTQVPPRMVGRPADAFAFWVTKPVRYVLYGYPSVTDAAQPVHGTALNVALVCTLVAVAAAPLALVLPRLRWACPWVATGIVFTALGIWTSVSDTSASLLLSGLWYGLRERLRGMMLPLYGVCAVAGACAVGLVLEWVVRAVVTRLRRAPGKRRTRWARGPAAAGVALLGTLAVCAAQPQSWQPLRASAVSRAPQGPQYERVFRWLATHTGKNEVVAYDRHLEMMTWSYADYGTKALFGIPPLDPTKAPNFQRRVASFTWLAGAPGAPPSGCDVKALHIEFIAVGQRRIPAMPASYSRQRLSSSPLVRLVHSDDGLRVYRVTDAGRVCPVTR